MEVLGDGAVVKMLDGKVFEIDEIDRIDTALWLPPEEAVVCWKKFQYGGQIITLHTIRADGDKVDARRIR